MTDDTAISFLLSGAELTLLPDTSVGAQARLRLLGTSDLHMHLTGFDYSADRPDVSIGLTRTASLIRAARNEADKCGALTLLFDNGDTLQGTPLGDLAAETAVSGKQVHPLMRAFRHLGYDAIGLGNHDFNFGLNTLLSVVAQAPCPVLSSNLIGVNGQELPGIAPFAILERTVQAGDTDHPVRIGVLSFLPPQTVQWDAYFLLGRVVVEDIVRSAQRWIPQLKQAGCDVIVALAHSGLDCAHQHEGMENAVLPLAALEGIDAIIAGHTHLHLPGTAHSGLENVCADTGTVFGKPVVMPGTHGSHLGVIDLKFDISPQARWSVTGFNCALRPIAERQVDGTVTPATQEDRALTELLEPIHSATKARLRQRVGHTSHPLHSYFSFIAPDRAMALVASAQAASVRSMLTGTAAADLPLLSAVAPCKFGGRSGPLHYTDISAGKMSLRHVTDLYVFTDQLRAIVVDTAKILEWLEKSASLFHQINPGNTDALLIDPAFPGHDFDVLHGLTWQIDLSVSPRFNLQGNALDPLSHRISDLRLNGRPVKPDQRFVVALNSYRASGGGYFTTLNDAEPLPIPALSIRQAICN